MDHPAIPTMLSPQQIDRALVELAPDALAAVERVLRPTSRLESLQLWLWRCMPCSQT